MHIMDILPCFCLNLSSLFPFSLPFYDLALSPFPPTHINTLHPPFVHMNKHTHTHSLFTSFPLQYNKPSDLVVPEMVNGLQDNLDVVVSLAERHYYNCDFKMCYKLTSM